MSERPILNRLEEGAKFACVVRAINACSPATRRGKRSKCWALDTPVQHRVAHMVCVNKATLDEVLESLKHDLKGIDRSSMNRWLKPIIAAYQSELNRASLQDEATVEMAVHEGDLVAQMAVAWGSAMLVLARYLKDIDWNDLDNNDKGRLLQFLDASTDAAKVQAQAKEREAKTQRILFQLKSTLLDANDKPKSDRSRALATAFAKIDELLGLAGVNQ